MDYRAGWCSSRRLRCGYAGFSEQGLRALSVAIRKVRILGLIFENPTITRADVKIIFVPYARTEANPVDVVIVIGLIDSDYRHFAPWIGDVGIGADCKPRDMGHPLIEDSAGVGRVTNIEMAVDRVVRIESHAENSVPWPCPTSAEISRNGVGLTVPKGRLMILIFPPCSATKIRPYRQAARPHKAEL